MSSPAGQRALRAKKTKMMVGMMWFLLSLCTAMATASQDAWVKKYFNALSVFEMAAFPLVYSFPLVLAACIWVPVPPLDSVFWWNFWIGLPLNGLAYILYMRAIQLSPLSLTIPFLAFTPTFMIVPAYLFLHEIPDSWGLIGIIVTCAGGYVINLDTASWSPMAPIRAILREPGSWMMLIVAFLTSFTAVIGKLIIIHSSPLFSTVFFFSVFNGMMTVLMWLTGKVRWRTLIKAKGAGIMAGLLYFLHIVLHSYAIAIAKAAYMISIKRLSVLISVIYGGLFFKETHIVMRFIGSVLMLLGAVLILLKAT